MAETAVESGRWSGTNEAHATLAKLGEERVVGRNDNWQTLGMEQFRIIEQFPIFRTALNAHPVGIWVLNEYNGHWRIQTRIGTETCVKHTHAENRG